MANTTKTERPPSDTARQPRPPAGAGDRESDLIGLMASHRHMPAGSATAAGDVHATASGDGLRVPEHLQPGESAGGPLRGEGLRRIAPDKETLAWKPVPAGAGRTVSNQRRVRTYPHGTCGGLRGEAVHAELLRLGESLTAGP